MTDLDIINKFRDKKQIKYFIFEKIYPLEYEYLINRFNDSLCLKESLLRVLYNINEHPKCPICGRLCKNDFRQLKSKNPKIFAATCGNIDCISKNWANKQHEYALNTYGVDNVFQAEEIKEKIKETSIKKYGVEHPFKNENVKSRFKKTCLEKYGVEWFCFTEKNKLAVNSKESIEKGIQTKKERGNLNTSEQEKKSEKILKEKYSDLVCQYKSLVYPYHCDFYIPSLDLYIECNYHWTHGYKPYEGNKEDLKLLNQWEESNTKFYNNAINTWTIRDVNKRNIAKQNNLNWIEFFTMKEFLDWFNNL